MTTSLLLTCEHATNDIPSAYRHLFVPTAVVAGPWGKEKTATVLADHWGWDPGALTMAKFLQKKTGAPLHMFPVSRLLIEGNRYLRPSLFSVFTNSLSKKEKQQLQEEYWMPHVEGIRADIKKAITSGNRVIHLGVHTFTPVRNGVVRNADMGILFDPTRSQEKKFAHELQRNLASRLPELRIRRNYPYTGYSEGLTKLLRKEFADSTYVGIEIETNNKHVATVAAVGKRIMQALAESTR